MRKPVTESPELSEEEMITEMIELTCEEMDTLSRAFKMISRMCDQLQHEVLAESLSEVPERQIN